MSSNNQYRSTLGNSFLSRARTLFLIGFSAFFISSTALVYAGVQSGELERRVVRPVQQTVASVIASLEESHTRTSDDTYEYDMTGSDAEIRSNVEVNINTTTRSSGANQAVPTVIYYQYPTQTPYEYTGPSYEERVQQMNQEADQRWQEALQRQAELQQSNQQSLDEFRALSEKCGEEFLANKGEYVSDECKNR